MAVKIGFTSLAHSSLSRSERRRIYRDSCLVGNIDAPHSPSSEELGVVGESSLEYWKF